MIRNFIFVPFLYSDLILKLSYKPGFNEFKIILEIINPKPFQDFKWEKCLKLSTDERYYFYYLINSEFIPIPLSIIENYNSFSDIVLIFKIVYPEKVNFNEF